MEAIMNRHFVNLPDYHVEWYVTKSKRGKKDKRIVDVRRFLHTEYGVEDQYEVMLMDGDGTEIECFRTFDYGEAKEAYARMVRENAPEPWKALITDLGFAKEIAESVRCGDGGTCNFDSPALHIPEGMTYQQVVACCKAAGISCFDWKPFKKSKRLAVIGCHGIGQANRRTEGAEAACTFLNERGYTCSMYYQMD